jgi:uncharacterized protein YegP (UPF0339 family)
VTSTTASAGGLPLSSSNGHPGELTKREEDQVIVYRGSDRGWRWVRHASNGEPLSSSTEGYVRRAYAEEIALALNPDCTIIVREEE